MRTDQEIIDRINARKEADFFANLVQFGQATTHRDRKRFLVGTGHGSCTCQGAAFEYIVNLEFELRQRGVKRRDGQGRQRCRHQ